MGQRCHRQARDRQTEHQRRVPAHVSPHRHTSVVYFTLDGAESTMAAQFQAQGSWLLGMPGDFAAIVLDGDVGNSFGLN
eukprot:8210498-Pyramimonas_sp.AAC.1